MSINGQLLQAIRDRQQKQTEFSFGILTADRYVKTIEEMIGSENCNKFASKDQTSFSDVLLKASQTLVYSNPDMVVEKKSADRYTELSEEVELPKNTLMVFRHVLTTPRKDRDGDILRTEGMIVDPKMLLLWQHIHTMPIGKMLMEVLHNKDQLVLDSCIIDMNSTCHDAAVMVDNDMGRFSHGFRALELTRVKEEDGTETGYDIIKGEIMEESLVSVPSNVDADTMEVILSLVEGGKLTSPVMKEVGKTIREKRDVRIPVNLDVKVTVNGQEVENEDDTGNGKGTGDKTDTGASKEADGDTKGQTEKKVAHNQEMTKMLDCGYVPGSWEYIEYSLGCKLYGMLSSYDPTLCDSSYYWMVGTFPDHVVVQCEPYSRGSVRYFRCDWEMKEGEASFSGEPKEVKIEISVDVQDKLAVRRLKATVPSKKKASGGVEVKDAMTLILCKANQNQRNTLLRILKSFSESEERSQKVVEYRSLTGS